MAKINTLKNSVTLITGGASGLGRATVERFINQGSRVVVCDLQTTKGHELQEQFGDKCLFVPTDVTVERDVKSALDATVSAFGRLDNVVNCAGDAISCKIFHFQNREPHPLGHFNDLLKVNVSGTFNVVRLAAEVISRNVCDPKSQKGVIINTSAISAYDGQTGQSAFAASQGAVASMTLPLSRELASERIRVVAIAPGMFRTPMLTGLTRKVQTMLAEQVIFPHKLGEPDEFAHLCQSIIENSMINGEVIRLDGAIRFIH